MSKQSESFLRYFLPSIDTRKRILIFAELQSIQTNVELDIKAINIEDEIFLYSIEDVSLIKDIVTPVEDIFKTHIGEKEFIRVFLKYVHLETINKIKNKSLVEMLYKSTSKRKLFLLSKKHMQLDITYRKWQLEQLEKEL